MGVLIIINWGRAQQRMRYLSTRFRPMHLAAAMRSGAERFPLSGPAFFRWASSSPRRNSIRLHTNGCHHEDDFFGVGQVLQLYTIFLFPLYSRFIRFASSRLFLAFTRSFCCISNLSVVHNSHTSGSDLSVSSRGWRSPISIWPWQIILVARQYIDVTSLDRGNAQRQR